MGCSSSKPRHRRSRKHRRRRRRAPPTGDLEAVPEEEFKVPVYQADRSEFEGEGQTYRSEFYGQEENHFYDHNTKQGNNFKQATYNGIHDIRVHHYDVTECRVKGAEFLPNGHLLICDQANNKLKLFNAAFKYLSHYKLSGSPHELCVLASDKEGSDVYITIPSQRTIVEISVEDRVFVKGQIIKTDAWCYGIAPFRHGLVVGVGTKVVFMDTEGHELKTIQYDKNGDSMFESPFHIAVTPDNDILVSDLLRQCIIGITPDGETLFRYTKLTIPHGLLVDSQGYVYLSGATTEAVDVLHQISSGGDKVKSLLSWRHVGFRPDTVCFRQADQMLAVCGESDRIKTFTLHNTKTGKMNANDVIMDDSVPDKLFTERSTPEVQEEMKRILRS